MADEAGRVACYLARDLLIPYAAGEVTEPTRAWIDRHLAACGECRRAFAEATGTNGAVLSAPPPSPAAEQRLMRRVRRTVQIILGVIIALALAVGGLIWSIGQVKRLANIPEVHPVPAASMTAREAVELDLSPVRLTRTQVTEARVDAAGYQDGAMAHFETEDGHQVEVWVYRFGSAGDALDFADRWQGQFKVQLMRFASQTWDQSVAKFRSGGHYYYTWSADGWLIIIAVPEGVREPARLRDQIRDLIFIAYTPA
jgi:hypothetical protein